MTRKKVKLAWIENANARTTSLKKRRIGLLKKVKEITILCDVKACLIIFSPNDVEPMIWPSTETTRELLDTFFALPSRKKVKKELTMESYMKEKITKMHEDVTKLKKKNMENNIDLLMDQINRSPNHDASALNVNEIYMLIHFIKENILRCRQRLGPGQYLPLQCPPRLTFGVAVGGHVEDESARNSIGAVIMGNKGQYVMDDWVEKAAEPSEAINQKQIGMNQVCYQTVKSYLPFQGSSSNGNPNVEMEPSYYPMMWFYDFGGLVSQPLQNLDINENTVEPMNQPMQYPFNPMSGEFGVNQEENNINNGGSDQFYGINNNTNASNDGVGQEQAPTGTMAGEGNVDATPFDVNTAWLDFYNP